jgi:hypothetical protein
MEWSASVLTTDVVMIKGQEDPSMQISTIGIDIGKTCFHFVGFDREAGSLCGASARGRN